MDFAVELYLSEESEKKINKIFYRVEQKGYPVYPLRLAARPHISIGLYKDLSVDNFKNKLEAFSKLISPVNIKFSGIGTFPGKSGVVFLIPTISDKLFEIHKSFHELFDPQEELYSHLYQPGNWVPHCTIAFGLDDDEVFLVMKECMEFDYPIEVTLNQIGLASFKPSNNIECYFLDRQ